MKTKRKKIFKLSLILIAVVVFILIRFTEQIGFDKSPEERFRIIRVIDGDTVILSGGDKLRLLSIDTPEKDELYYNEARQMINRVALDKISRIEYANYRRDKYGRLLGYLYIDTIFVNKMILDSGYGNLYLFKDNELDNEQSKVLFTAQTEAIENRRGIWSIEKNEEDYYINVTGSYRLHRPGCRNLSRSNESNQRRIENRLEAFKEGLSPCRTCKP